MQLTFLGTRGGDDRSRQHRHHSALQIDHAHRRILVDCGDHWGTKLPMIAPDAILVTHARGDKAGGLGEARCPVYASAMTCRALAGLPIDLHALKARTRIGGLTIETFPVVHSRIAPAVGFRIGGRLCYVPDVVEIPGKLLMLRGLGLYIGDGALLSRPLVRRTEDGQRFGHTSIARQLLWCARAGIPRAYFTHCGTGVVRDHARAAKVVRDIGHRYAIDARLARDGLVIEL